MKLLINLTAAVLLLLAISNPTTAQYSAWIKEQLAAAAKGNPLVSLAAYAFGDSIIQATTQRRSLLFFSVFVTNIDGNHQGVTLGVAGNFFPLSPAGTQWRPGSPSERFPHVIAETAFDTWKPEDGYVWVRQPPNGDLRVRWDAGRSSEMFPHVVAAAAEQRWVPADGYVWDIDLPPAGQLGVHWAAGRSSSKFEHIVSTGIEGRWLPESGYRWRISPPPRGDMRVVPVRQLSPAEPTLSLNQREAGCSYTGGELLCPGPGTGLCWARGHDPNKDEMPVAVDVGNKASPDFGRGDLCSQANTKAFSPERALLFGRP